MILSFMRTLPTGEPSEFAAKIQDGRKQHTIRSGARWARGMKVHLWSGNPRNRKTTGAWEFFCFDDAKTETGENIPYFRAYVDQTTGAFLPVVRSVESVKMKAEVVPPKEGQTPEVKFGLWVGGRTIKGKELEQLATRDGLTLGQFLQYFVLKTINAGGEWTGQLINWGPHVYTPETARVLAQK